MNKNNQALSFFFWFTFGAFLAPSIPHIAYFFHSFEPSAQGAEDIWWWAVCYAIAVSIDGTIIWLSRTVAVAKREKASGGYIGSVWAFIVFLTGVSWLLNWFYAKHNLAVATNNLSGGITESVMGVSFTDVTPVLASMFPVLAIMFTLIADKVIVEKVKTLEELEQEATDLERQKDVLARIKTAKSVGKTSLIQRLKSTAIEARDAANEVLNSDGNASQIDAQTTHELEHESDENHVQSQPELIAVSDQIEPATDADLTTAELPDTLQITLNFMAENPQATDEELAEVLGLKRPASARFWRLKAQEILPQNSHKITRELPANGGAETSQLVAMHVSSDAHKNENGFRQQVRYSPDEAIRLDACKKSGVKIREIRQAIAEGKLTANASGKFSKTALENWLKSRQPKDIAS